MTFVTGAGAAWLVGRLVWEQTVLSWRHGPQMVGFSLMHTELGLFLLLLVSTLLFVLCLSGAVAVTAVALWRGRPIPALRCLGIALGVCVLGTAFVPYATWQCIFVAKIAVGPYASEFLTYAAATGDLSTVEALIQRGVHVNARNKNGSTAVHAAAVEGQVAILEYLISRGADLNIKNDFGHTALDNAREMKREGAARYLVTHGAR